MMPKSLFTRYRLFQHQRSPSGSSFMRDDADCVGKTRPSTLVIPVFGPAKMHCHAREGVPDEMSSPSFVCFSTEGPRARGSTGEQASHRRTPRLSRYSFSTIFPSSSTAWVIVCTPLSYSPIGFPPIVVTRSGKGARMARRLARVRLGCEYDQTTKAMTIVSIRTLFRRYRHSNQRSKTKASSNRVALMPHHRVTGSLTNLATLQ